MSDRLPGCDVGCNDLRTISYHCYGCTTSRLGALTLHHLLKGSHVQMLFLSRGPGGEIGAGHQEDEGAYLGIMDAVVKAGVPHVLARRWDPRPESAMLLPRRSTPTC